MGKGKWVSNFNNSVMSIPFLYELARGNIPGCTPWVKIGFNADVDNVEEDLWSVGGVYVPPSAAMQMEVVSSSADDASGGTGVKSVIIYYLDSNYREQSEIVTLNGTTEVPTTAKNILRVNNFRAYTVGTGGKAAGAIDVRHLSDTPIYTRILAGYTRARNSFYTVPLNKILYVTSVKVGVGNASGGRYARFTTRATYDEKLGERVPYWTACTEISVQDGSLSFGLEIPSRFPEMTDIKVSAISDSVSADAICTCAIRGWLELEG